MRCRRRSAPAAACPIAPAMPRPSPPAKPTSTSARRAAPKAWRGWRGSPGLPVRPIDPRFGVEGPRALAVIDEAWCIGCTLCLDACPTDAIVGIPKRMHTVIDQHCTGCELCIPVCPVDCISLDVVTEGRSGWAAWSQTQANEARARYAVHARRLGAPAQRATTKGEAPPADASQDGATASEKPDPEAQKRLIVATALARARAKLKP